jgi:aryl-alcohol dehydrogenase-like predicted oxidoreductase
MPAMTTARATAEGTLKYQNRMATAVAPDFFRAFAGLRASSIGVGTYLGGADDSTDANYADAISTAVSRGINVIDTAVNYRRQRSERMIGKTIAKLRAAGSADRDELIVCTKGGYLVDTPSKVVQAGLAKPDEIVANCHCVAPAYLREQIGRSLQNLNLEGVDVYYLHNPEQQLDQVDRGTFRSRIRAAFELLEELSEAGRIGSYGVATWNGFRVESHARSHLDLGMLLTLARETAGDRHHFRVVQLPYNLSMTEAATAPTQPLEGRDMSLLEAAEHLGISVATSASLMQGKLVPTEGAAHALEHVRVTRGVAVALCGMSKRKHVLENISLIERP